MKRHRTDLWVCEGSYKLLHQYGGFASRKFLKFRSVDLVLLKVHLTAVRSLVLANNCSVFGEGVPNNFLSVLSIPTVPMYVRNSGTGSSVLSQQCERTSGLY